MRHLKIEKAADGYATLTLDNADETMNVVSDAFIADMEEATKLLREDVSVKGVILTSAKKAFMAGADLKQLVRGYGRLSVKEAFAFSQRATAMHRAMEQSGKPWVAVINGLALGGGFELALACHHRILVDDAKAVVGLPEVTVGLLPGSGGTQRLLRIAGVKVASDLLLSGRSVAPAEALKLGIVDEVVPAADATDRARAWLGTAPDPVKPWDVKGAVPPQKRGMTVPEDSMAYMMGAGAIAGKSGYNLPAPLAILSTIFEGAQLPFDKALSVESKYFARLLTDPVARNIIRTTFISKQAAEKGARRPAGVPKSEVKKVGVLGAGMMGAGIAYVSANAGIEVILLDRDVQTAEHGKAYSQKVQAKLIEKGKLDQEKADALLARITPTDDFALLEGCDLIVEAVFEDTAIKAETTARAEAVIPSTAVFASNTSTLPISQLAQASGRPDQFIGIHFFSPVDRMGLVEVIMGKQTSQKTLAKALDYIAQLRKTPIVVNDSRGFYTSRVFQTLIHEGGAMLEEGVPPAVIENAAKAIGMPVGPLALLDELTFDLPLKIVDQAIAEEGDRYLPPAGVPTLRKMRDQLGRSGRKSGGGFYDYPEGGKKHLWKGLAEHFPVRSDYDVEELKTRFLYAQAMETARCLEEGVLETPEDADLGALYGWGFPAWTGGTISYIDTVGLERFVREADRLAQAYGPRFAPSAWLRDKAASGVPFYADASEPVPAAPEPACAA
ncbi:3-hydroxyacyl-CoA dehydrogenase NAD-binding domain-containing protein [Sphingomonas sp. KC8]|uniref:3-hydroxyacyl-CoA dehydrogenase NAD-binding domain-containing protein n=1 Tax=Sphingomonas sp. KC8 TaxID=1030157 RepID=UPI000248BBB3|nr:3-hydroxyacyl-CoA dehydrogenase NAD-binding domain-containing protein [Sphingomonas sp. KC8]ARS26899.1 3-hydroxyacyl-CoA dehydrogenase [Sphingomonas sp. KC8]